MKAKAAWLLPAVISATILSWLSAARFCSDNWLTAKPKNAKASAMVVVNVTRRDSFWPMSNLLNMRF
jgi:hypothetical protein